MKKALIKTTCLLFLSFGGHSQAIIKTIAGTGTSAYSGDGGPAISAEMMFPVSVANDTSGNVYVIDLISSTLRKIDATSGTINIVAGNPSSTGSTGDGGDAASAKLYQPMGVFVDVYNNIYISDNGNNKILMISGSTNIITTVAGNGAAGSTGDGGAATAANLNSPYTIAVDDTGNVLIADAFNNKIRKVSASTGIITTIAGTGTAGYSGDGGPAISAQLDTPISIATDHFGNIYIADNNNLRIRKISTATSTISTYAGDGSYGYSGDGGAATAAKFRSMNALSTDGSGNLYISDQRSSVIRKVTVATGIITTIAGNGIAGFSGDGGSATTAKLNWPIGVCTNIAGDVIYIADKLNYRIRKVYTPTVSVKETVSNAAYLVVPNPTIGKISITSTTNATIKVYNTIGQLIASANDTDHISIKEFPTGLYFVRVFNEQGELLKQERVVKQ